MSDFRSEHALSRPSRAGSSAVTGAAAPFPGAAAPDSRAVTGAAGPSARSSRTPRASPGPVGIGHAAGRPRSRSGAQNTGSSHCQAARRRGSLRDLPRGREGQIGHHPDEPGRPLRPQVGLRGQEGGEAAGIEVRPRPSVPPPPSPGPPTAGRARRRRPRRRGRGVAPRSSRSGRRRNSRSRPAASRRPGRRSRRTRRRRGRRDRPSSTTRRAPARRRPRCCL